MPTLILLLLIGVVIIIWFIIEQTSKQVAISNYLNGISDKPSKYITEEGKAFIEKISNPKNIKNFYDNVCSLKTGEKINMVYPPLTGMKSYAGLKFKPNYVETKIILTILNKLKKQF